jgi:SAM-dependent methyltransferase
VSRSLETAHLYALGAAYRTGLYQRLALRHRVTRRDFKLLMDYWVASGRDAFPRHEFPTRHDASGQVWLRESVMPPNASDQEHFALWQRRDLGDYLLLSAAASLSRYPLTAHRFMWFVPDGARVCEYGAGPAPMAHAISRFYRYKHLSLTIADIPAEWFRFAKHTFRGEPFVDTLDIAPNDDTPLADLYDVIFCITVFEHLPRPLAIAQHFHERLRPGGRLIFDYLLTDGTGVDLPAAAEARPEVFAWLRERFDGDLDEASPGQFFLTKKA